MRDLALHLLDILENSVKAGAQRVDLTLRKDGPRIWMRIADNGPGLPDSVRPDPTDPFRTTRTERKVGLGLALLRQSAEEAGGFITVEEPATGGVAVTCCYDTGHIDAKPLGDLVGAILTALLSWPGVHLVVHVDNHAESSLDSAHVRRVLADVPLESAAVQKFLREQLDTELKDLIGSQN